MIKSFVAVEHLKEFPKLVSISHDSLVVLMHKDGRGTVLKSTLDGFKIGEFKKDWNLSEFTDFKGELILENL